MTSHTSVLDDFNRANEGPPPSANWSNINAGLKVISNVCGANAANSISYWNAAQYGPDCEVYGTITTRTGNGQSFGFNLRCKDMTLAGLDGYQLLCLQQAGTDIFRIQRLDNSVATVLGADVSQEFAANDKVLLRAVGSTLTFERNDAEVTTRTDTTYPLAGYLAAALTNTTGRFDNFGGGSLFPMVASRPNHLAINLVGRF